MQYKGMKRMKRAAAVIVSATILLADMQGVSATSANQVFEAETMEAESLEDLTETGINEGEPVEDFDAQVQTVEMLETEQPEIIKTAWTEATETETTEVETPQDEATKPVEAEPAQEESANALQSKMPETETVASEVEEPIDASEVAVDDEAVASDGKEITFKYYSEDNKAPITEKPISISVNDPVTIAAVFGDEKPTGASVRWGSDAESYVKVIERSDIVGENAVTLEGLKPTTDLYSNTNNGVVNISCVLTYKDDDNKMVMRSGVLSVRVKPLAQSITIKMGNAIATGKVAVYDIGTNKFIAVDNRRLTDTTVESLSASVDPLNANQKVTWMSSNTSIIRFVKDEGDEGYEVTDNGAKARGTNVKIESSGAGEAVITATAMDGSKKTGTVTVKTRRVIQELSFTPKPLDKDGVVSYNEEEHVVEIAEGTSIYLEPAYTPIEATVKKVSWTCDNNSAVDMSVNESTNVLKLTTKDGTGGTEVKLTATATDMSEKSWTVTVNIKPRVKKLEIYKAEDKNYEKCLNGQNIGVDPDKDSKILKLKAKCYPDSALQAVRWSINDEKIATIDEFTGEVTIKPDVKGTAVVTATAIDGSRTTAVTTLNVTSLVTDVEIEGSTMVMKGKTIKLTATVKPLSVTNVKCKWKSIMPDIASVNENTGEVTGKKQGFAIIIATAADGSGKESEPYTIQVTDVPEKFDIVDKNNNIINGKMIGIDPDQPKPADGSLTAVAIRILPDTACQEVEWKSSNEKIATIKDGVITAKAVGKATITAKAIDGSGKIASIVVNVNTLATGVAIMGGHYLARDMTLQLKAEITNKDAATRSVIWKSSAPKIAEVDETGLVTAVGKDGTAVITAEAADGSGASKEHTIYVVNGKGKIDNITSNTEPYVVNSDKKKNLTMDVDLSTKEYVSIDLEADLEGYERRDGKPYDIKWSTSSKSIATVEAGKSDTRGSEIGHVTLYKAGIVKITATSAEGSESSKTVTITVKNDNPVVKITASGHLLAKGKKMKLSTGGVPVTWETSDEGIATVNSKGQVTADRYDSGRVTITARAEDGGLSDTYEIVVGDPIQSIDLKINNQQIQPEDQKKKIGVDIVNGCEYNEYKGSEITLSAILNFDEDISQDAGLDVTWKTSNKGVAVIDENGKVELKKKGTVTFTATATDGTNKKAKVTFVVSKQVEEMSSGTGEIYVGLKKSIQLGTEIEYRPLAATKPKLVWEIVDGDSDAVSVGKNNGKVTGRIEEETVRIRATDANNKKVSCEFTVHIVPSVDKVEIVENGKDYQDAVGIELGDSNSSPREPQLRVKLYAKGDEEGVPTLGERPVIWSSSNTAIAEVDKNGKVTAHKSGEVTITATATDGSKKKGKIKVCCGKLVNQIIPSETIEHGIDLDLTKKNKKVIDLANKLRVYPVTATNRALTYTSTDKSVVTVSAKGKVTAKGGGPAEIIVTSKDGGCSRSISVYVRDSSDFE